MPTKVPDRTMRGDRAACPLCAPPKKDTVRACDVWARSLELANGLPALKR